MGLVHANIKLTNADDLALMRRKYISADEVRNIEVTAMVDSGAYMLAINERIKHQLGFIDFNEKKSAQLADGSLIELEIVGPIEVRFENRRTVCEAMVLPGETEILLGAIPMEAMDVLIHPKEQKLIVNPAHPYQAQLALK
jgi:clan AA aspartic protease